MDAPGLATRIEVEVVARFSGYFRVPDLIDFVIKVCGAGWCAGRVVDVDCCFCFFLLL